MTAAARGTSVNESYGAEAAAADDDRRHLKAEPVLEIPSAERTDERSGKPRPTLYSYNWMVCCLVS